MTMESEFLSTISEDEDYYIITFNSYHKLEWDEIEDQRNFEQTDADLNFEGTLRWEQKEVVDKFLKEVELDQDYYRLPVVGVKRSQVGRNNIS